MSSLCKKTVFTPEQRASFKAAYSDGLSSTGAVNSTAIGTLAEELQLDVSVIKVRWGHTRGCMYCYVGETCTYIELKLSIKEMLE